MYWFPSASVDHLGGTGAVSSSSSAFDFLLARGVLPSSSEAARFLAPFKPPGPLPSLRAIFLVRVGMVVGVGGI
jgi:hypothetical protein